jgi:predicted NBD/HSP70 family sugar kinase
MRARAPAGSPSLLRRHNSALILETIRRDGPISRAALARATGLSKPTVNEVAELLLEQGYVEEAADAGDGPRRPGPRARQLRFRADIGHVLGIDVGADKTLALVADLSGRIVATERHEASGRAGRAAVLRAVERTARGALAQAGLEPDALRMACIATPGVVDPASGRISLAPQIAGWDGLDLGGHLESRLGCPVAADNEARLSLLAEVWRGAARDVRHVAYVQVGIGIGGALLIDGRLFRGKSGAAGEISYLLDVDEPEDDAPGGTPTGPFERAAGGRAYARLGAGAATRPEGALLRELAGGDPDAVSARTVFDAAERGDAAAVAIVAELTARLGRGVANVATVVDPELVVLGGGIGNAGRALLEPVERAVRAAVPFPPRIVLSELGGDGGALGAVRRALDAVDERLFSFEIARRTPAPSP